MKHKILSFLTAFAMVLGVIAAPFASVNAAGESTDPDAKTETVTLHKLMMSKDNLKKWDSGKVEKDGYDGTQDLDALKKLKSVAGKDVREVSGVYFALKFADGDNADSFVKADPDDKSTPAKPLAATDDVDKAVGGLTTGSGFKFNTSALEGKFKIVEVKEKSNYKSEDGKTIVDQKAVPVEITLPLVNSAGTVINAHVYPKNTEDKPEIDKNFKKDHGLKIENDENENANSGAVYENYIKKKAQASATVGKEIPYEVKTKIAAGTSYENLTWNDTMTNGLTYNKDLEVTADNVTFEDGDYELVQDASGFRLKMNKSGLDKIKAKTIDAEEQVDVNITLTYSATINGSAVVDNPEKNNVTLEYGHKPGKDLEEKTVTPKDGELKVNKSFGEGDNTEGLNLVYTLKNDNGEIASVQLDNKTSGTIDLGNGITFEIESAFNGTFKGLPEGENYTISERVAGYNPEYATENAAGQIKITNNKDNDNPTPLNPQEPKVENYGKRFVKADQKTGERLQGAEFVIKKDNKFLALKDISTTEGEGKALAEAKKAYDDALEAWNKAVKENPETADEEIQVQIGENTITGKTAAEAKIKELQDAYQAAFEKSKNAYEWVDSQNADNVVTLVSDSQGKFEIKGLEKGTYTLVETKKPAGYATKKDETFEVGPGTYAEHANGVTYESDDSVDTEGQKAEAQRIDNKKVTIPETGGIGSIIFVIAGLMIMGLAAYKMKANKEQA